MLFSKKLRGRIISGEIVKSVRIWKSARVKPGNAYRLEQGHVIVDSIHSITFDDITPGLARETGFNSVVDLLRTAKHGEGERIYLVSFHYVDDLQ